MSEFDPRSSSIDANLICPVEHRDAALDLLDEIMDLAKEVAIMGR